jgi:DNA-binding NtrC family response regulator
VLYRYVIIAGQGESFALSRVGKTGSEGGRHDWENEIKWLANAVLKLRTEVDELKKHLSPEHTKHSPVPLQLEDMNNAIHIIQEQEMEEMPQIPHVYTPISAPHSVSSQPYDEIEEVKEEDNLNLEDMEKRSIIRALQQSHNRRKIAAQMLGISERTLYRKIKDYGIEE